MYERHNHIGIDNTEFIDNVVPLGPEIIYADPQFASQNIIRPRQRDVNSRNIVVNVFGGDGVYNVADGVVNGHGAVVTVGPGICAVQSLDTILFVFRSHNELFDDVVLYVQ
ncbi:25154_t:CDS:2, partial [Gigaspora rosea]